MMQQGGDFSIPAKFYVAWNGKNEIIVYITLNGCCRNNKNALWEQLESNGFVLLYCFLNKVNLKIPTQKQTESCWAADTFFPNVLSSVSYKDTIE